MGLGEVSTRFELDQVMCEDCYAGAFAHRCKICEDPIISGNKITLLDEHYHADCFKCSRCSTNQDLIVFQSKLFCKRCAKMEAGSISKYICDGCHNQVHTQPFD